MEAIVHPDGRLIWRGQAMTCALGKGGVKAEKVEGDEATPAATMALRRVLYRADRLPPPRCAVPVEPIAQNDAWCDDPGDKSYNRLIRLPYDAHHEELWRRDELYDVIGVLGWNDAPVVRGRGSAIFLHLARQDYAPTEGCIALKLPDLERVLAEGLTSVRVLPD